MVSLLKMNYFHWHLTEGLGWRIEIKQYPRLAQIGGSVGKGEEQQGFIRNSVVSVNLLKYHSTDLLKIYFVQEKKKSCIS